LGALAPFSGTAGEGPDAVGVALPVVPEGGVVLPPARVPVEPAPVPLLVPGLLEPLFEVVPPPRVANPMGDWQTFEAGVVVPVEGGEGATGAISMAGPPAATPPPPDETGIASGSDTQVQSAGQSASEEQVVDLG
jgi:hypothetical protein